MIIRLQSFLYLAEKSGSRSNRGILSLQMLLKTIRAVEDPASPTLPLGTQQTLCFLLHPLDSCLKAFSRLRSTLGLRAEQAGMLSLSPATALNPELHSTWRPEVPGEQRLTHPQHLPVNGVHILTPSSSCPTSPLSHQYFLS